MYGYSFTAHKTGFFLVLNGWCITTYRGLNSGKRSFGFYKNYWRKTNTRITNG